LLAGGVRTADRRSDICRPCTPPRNPRRARPLTLHWTYS